MEEEYIAPAKLRAENKTPDGGDALTAYNKAANGLEPIGCYYVELYAPSRSADGTALDMMEGEQVTLKIMLPNGVGASDLKLFRITGDSAEPEQIAYTYVKRDGESYVIFDTDSLGYFALLSREGNPATGSSPAVSLAVIMSISAVTILGTGLFRKRK